MNPFKLVPVYVKVFVNRMEVTNLLTGETAAADAILPFSSERLGIGDFDAAERLLGSIFKELGLRSWLLSPPLKILIHQLEKTDGGLSSVEKRALRDLGKVSGAKTVIIAHGRPLENEEALNSFTRPDFEK